MNSHPMIKMMAIVIAFALCATDALAQRGSGGRGVGGGGRIGGSSMRGAGGGGYSRGGGSGYNRGGGDYARGGSNYRSSGNNWNNGRGYSGNYGRYSGNNLNGIYGGNYGGGYRYSSGYRGLPGYGYGSAYGGYPSVQMGLGSGYGRYGYGYFPWYSGLGFYGGLNGLGRTFGNGVYGSGYYNNGSYYSDNGGSTTVYQQSPPADDYVPQVNNTSAQLVEGATGTTVLGITMDPNYSDAAVIRRVRQGTPAEAAGLRPGDMIATIDERVIGSPADVTNLVSSMRPGDVVNIQFVRPIPRSQVQQAAPEVQPSTSAATPTS